MFCALRRRGHRKASRRSPFRLFLFLKEYLGVCLTEVQSLHGSLDGAAAAGGCCCIPHPLRANKSQLDLQFRGAIVNVALVEMISGVAFQSTSPKFYRRKVKVPRCSSVKGRRVFFQTLGSKYKHLKGVHAFIQCRCGFSAG